MEWHGQGLGGWGEDGKWRWVSGVGCGEVVHSWEGGLAELAGLGLVVEAHVVGGNRDCCCDVLLFLLSGGFFLLLRSHRRLFDDLGRFGHLGLGWTEVSIFEFCFIGINYSH